MSSRTISNRRLQHLFPHRQLLPHRRLLPHRQPLPHRQLLPHRRLLPHRQPLHHRQLMPHRRLLLLLLLLLMAVQRRRGGSRWLMPGSRPSRGGGSPSSVKSKRSGSPHSLTTRAPCLPARAMKSPESFTRLESRGATSHPIAHGSRSASSFGIARPEQGPRGRGQVARGPVARGPGLANRGGR